MALVDNYYPTPNSQLISLLKLLKHPEGGYFAETDREVEQVPSPFAEGEPRPLATSIFYLLEPKHPRGVFHLNKSVTYHVLHQGRAEYTLIFPGENGKSPRVEKHVMGTNAAAGELRQLLVGTNVWKMSQLLSSDLAACNQTKDGEDRWGCLITEVVTPGFVWEDHQFMTNEKLQEIFEGSPDGDTYVEEYSKFVKKAN